MMRKLCLEAVQRERHVTLGRQHVFLMAKGKMLLYGLLQPNRYADSDDSGHMELECRKLIF